MGGWRCGRSFIVGLFGSRWGSVECYGGGVGGRDDVPGIGFMVCLGGCVGGLS